ncbi:IS3 family transposase [Clostridium algidicarnis]|uniref:IS3 family transposase n=1 Tax=Clostridium algidicarnis TaxID=37659 RepID=UPI0027DFE379|nr:IS3 family transposase [Clostridium algidicarnis]
MNKYKGKYTVKRICKVLKFPRSTYYEALIRVPSKREIETEHFREKLQEEFEDSNKRYGAIKLQQKLQSSGIPCSVKRVQRHMKALNIHSLVVKKYRPHSTKNNVPEKENILDRDFNCTDINQKWCTDITYIHVLKEGWTYLASVMDLYSRRIVGYAYGKHITAELAVKAVENACLNVTNPNGIILHSDLGTQYTSKQFKKIIADKGLIHSFSRKGNPYDNACIESFHSILKKEEVYVHKYPNFEYAQRAIFEFIESWYNRKRIHGALNYMTPVEFENLRKEA